MKKLTFAVAILCVSVLQAENDKPFSTTTKLKADVHFGSTLFGRGSELGTDAKFDAMSNFISEKPLYGSAGNGMIFGAGVGYFPADFFGVRAGFSHLSGRWQTYDHNSYANGYETNEEFRGNYNELSMDVIIRTCCQGDWHGQASFGPSFFPGSNVQFRETTGTNGNTDYDIRRTLTNKAGFGLNAGFGGDYQINKHLAIGLDFRSTLFNATGKKEVYTKYDDKGTDNLPFMRTIDKETEYVDEINQNSNQSGLQGYDKNKPYNALAPKTSFNSFQGVLRATFTF